MKVLMVLGVLVLSGCGTLTSLEQLEAEAMLTGDWSAVEQREKVIARRQARQGPKCRSGQTSFCESYVGSIHCTCIGSEALRDALAWQR